MTPVIYDTDDVVMFTAGMVIDGDGAPNCYAPAGSGLQCLDYLANAMDGDRYVGVVCTPQGDPIVQGPNDPCPGCYVSPTSLVDASKGMADPARYVDASSVPYIAVCPELRQRGVRFGDLCMVIYDGKQSGAIVADGAPHNHYGEASIACAVALGIPSSPKNGGVSKGVTYVVFKGSAASPPWPLAVADIQAQAALLYQQWKTGASVR